MELDMETFDSNDRCDRCGMQALAVARKEQLELKFCWHHKAENELALINGDWTVISDYLTYESYRGK